MKKLCIFDLDGTLTNTLGSITHFLNNELEKHDVKLASAEEVKRFTGDGARALVERILAERNINDVALQEEILSSYIASYDADYLYLCKLYPGITETIAELKGHSVNVACLTNKPHKTAISIIESFFGSSFSLVWGQRDGFPVKPDPSGAIEIMKHFSVSPEQTLYVGDTATDVRTGKSAGCFTIGVLWGFRGMGELTDAGADAIIKDPSEILKFLED